MSSLSLSSSSGSAYVLCGPGTKQRHFASHGYTPASLIHTRFRENTSTVALSINFALPLLRSLNEELGDMVARIEEEQQSHSQPDPKRGSREDEVRAILIREAKTAGINYGTLLCRVGVHTGICCALIKTNIAFTNSVVFLTDMYPRLHSKYIGDVVQRLRLPRFIASMAGAAPTAKDLEVFTQDISAAAALEDAAKRNAVTLVADIVVDLGVTAAEHQQSSSSLKRRQKDFFGKVVMHTTSFAIRSLGAAGGRASAGATGEYWGEIVGILAAPVAYVYTVLAFHKLKNRSSSSGSKKSKVAAKQHTSSHKLGTV